MLFVVTWSVVDWCWLFALRCSLCVVCCVLFVFRCLMCVVCFVLFDGCYVLVVAYCFLLRVRCVTPVVW